MPPMLSPRTLIAAGGALVVLVTAGVVVLTADDPPPRAVSTAPTSSAPTGSPTPTTSATPGSGGASGTRFGAAPEGARNDYTAALAKADQTLGRLGVVRVYYQGAPDPWPGKAPGRNVVVSFKLPPAQVLDGTFDDQMRTWFADAPKDLDVNWVYQHEPEDDVLKDQAFTAEQFRTAFAHLTALARQAGNPRLQATLVLQSYTLKPQSGRDWHEFYPGDAAVDVFAWDVYNRPGNNQGEAYAAPEQLLDGIRGVSESVGKPFAIAELGSILASGDDGSQRAGWLRAVGEYVKSHRAVFVAYFDLNFMNGPNGQDDYRLRDPDSLQAWRDVTGA